MILFCLDFLFFGEILLQNAVELPLFRGGGIGRGFAFGKICNGRPSPIVQITSTKNRNGASNRCSDQQSEREQSVSSNGPNGSTSFAVVLVVSQTHYENLCIVVFRVTRRTLYCRTCISRGNVLDQGGKQRNMHSA